ncbi:MAG: hypothetical protein DRP08_03425, partial [Candidatus Aenigmatarchaeota archaeon]
MNKKYGIGIATIAVVITAIFAGLGVSGYDTDQTYYANSTFFVPENSTGEYCQNNTYVQVRINTSVPSLGGSLQVYFNTNCVNITAADFTGSPWTKTHKFSHWGNYVVIESSNDPGGATFKGDNLLATITLHCVNQTCCKSDLNFSTVNIGDSSGAPITMTPHNGTFMCEPLPGLEVDKKVKVGGVWDDGPIAVTPEDDEYRFRINVTANCCNFTNLSVTDILPSFMSYADSPSVTYPNGTSAAVNGTALGGNRYRWTCPMINRTETMSIEFNVTIDDTGDEWNIANVTAKCNETPDGVPGEGERKYSEDKLWVSSAPAWEKEIYLVPQNSSAPYCNTTEVEVWVNGTGMFQSGQINLTYNASCANVTNWVRNTDMFPHGDWNSSKPGEEWITFARNDEIDGRYMVGTLTIHCNNRCNCSTPLDMVDVHEVGAAVRHSELFDHNMKPIKTAWRDGKFTCTNPDLIVERVRVNADLRWGYRDRAYGPTNHTGAKTECNNISAEIKNIGNGNAGPFHVCFNVSHEGKPEKMLCKVPVESLADGESTTVWCRCSWYPFANENYTINVTADCQNEVIECNESNNMKLLNVTPVVHGYKGNSHQDGRNITTHQVIPQGHVNLRYHAGNSTYVSGDTNWTTYTVAWTKDNLSIPNSAVVKKALLNVFYTWAHNHSGDYWKPGHGYYPEFNLSFNSGANLTMADVEQNLTDRKGFGSFDFPTGMLVYNVTTLLDPY